MGNIVFMNQKGGVGKTTLALSIASYYFLKGERVAVIDCDPQASAIGFKQCQDEHSPLAGMQVYSIDNPHDLEDLGSLEEEIIFFDTAGNDTPLARAVLDIADIVIIPIKASALDARASITTYRLVQAAGKKCLYVLNQTINNSRMTEDTLDALRASGVRHLEARVGNYTQFIRTVGAGETPISDNKYSPASFNIKMVVAEMEKIMATED